MFIKVDSHYVVNTDHIVCIDIPNQRIYMDDGSNLIIDNEHKDAVMSALVRINNMTIVR